VHIRLSQQLACAGSQGRRLARPRNAEAEANPTYACGQWV
jgi:hypothetical protein